jgi:hypothetical protein
VKAGIAALLRGRRLTVKLQDGTMLRTPTDPKAENWLVGTQMFGRAVLELSDLTITPTERETLTKIFTEVFEAPGADTVEKLEKQAQEVLPAYLARAREAFADLNGRQIPGHAKLKMLVEILETAAEPDLPAGRLKQLLGKTREVQSTSDSPVSTLKPLAELLRAVERLRTQGKLDALAGIRERVTRLYPMWEVGSENGRVAEALKELHQRAKSEKFVLEAERAIQYDSQCFTSYAAAYRKRHEERHQYALTALGELQTHTGWSTVAESLQTQLCNPIVALDCESTVDVALPALTCRDCGKTLKELGTDIELIEYWLQQAVRALEEALAPPVQPKAKTAQTITMDLRSAEDLPRLYGRIAEVAKSALAQPRRVRVIFEDVDEN